MSGRYGPCFACCLAALLVSLPTPLKAASIPRVVGYIGLLTDASGEPMAGPVNLELRLYDAASEGSLLFTETHLAVPLQNGVFAVAIGSETSGGLPGPAHETAPPLPMNRAMSEGFHRAAVRGPLRTRGRARRRAPRRFASAPSRPAHVRKGLRACS